MANAMRGWRHGSKSRGSLLAQFALHRVMTIKSLHRNSDRSASRSPPALRLRKLARQTHLGQVSALQEGHGDFALGDGSCRSGGAVEASISRWHFVANHDAHRQQGPQCEQIPRDGVAEAVVVEVDAGESGHGPIRGGGIGR